MDQRLERNILFGSNSKNNIIETKILNEIKYVCVLNMQCRHIFQSFTSECVVFHFFFSTSCFLSEFEWTTDKIMFMLTFISIRILLVIYSFLFISTGSLIHLCNIDFSISFGAPLWYIHIFLAICQTKRNDE